MTNCSSASRSGHGCRCRCSVSTTWTPFRRRTPLLRMEHARAATETDIAWLNDLIHTERQKFEITAPVGEQRRASATLRRKERTA